MPRVSTSPLPSVGRFAGSFFPQAWFFTNSKQIQNDFCTTYKIGWTILEGILSNKLLINQAGQFHADFVSRDKTRNIVLIIVSSAQLFDKSGWTILGGILCNKFLINQAGQF